MEDWEKAKIYLLDPKKALYRIAWLEEVKETRLEKLKKKFDQRDLNKKDKNK